MAHVHEKIDFTATVYVVHSNKVLLRKHDKYNIWLGVGGHIELDEDPNQAAVREVKEEVGLEVTLVGNPSPLDTPGSLYKNLIPPKFLNRHHVSPTHEHVDLIYFGISDSDKVISENPIDVWKWFTDEELERNEQGINGDVLEYAKSALRELGT